MDRTTSRLRPGAIQNPNIQSPAPHPPAQTHAAQRPPRRNKWLIAVVAVALGVLLLGAVWWIMFRTDGPRSDRYQAVWLSNGQIFFGKLKDVDAKYLYLDEAYYTKKQDLPADATDDQKAAVANNVSLVKVGDELYGPEGNMRIRSDSVLFWQDLKSDSKVTKAIEDAK